MNEIFSQFADRRAGVPAEAIRVADANRAEMVPLFLREFERSAHANENTRRALFVAFHLLGQWREKSAYRPLAAFLRRSPDHVDAVLGDAITATAHRVMAAVFDGDPQPLYDIILDRNVDEFVRSRMCAALAMVTLRGQLPRDEAAQFLRSCDTALQPRDDCPVWEGWQNAIAMLGLAELTPEVKGAFEDGRIDPSWLMFKHFEQDLQNGLAGIPPPHAATNEYELFGDTIEELTTWDSFQPRKEGSQARSLAWSSEGTVHNPLRNIGRNDPCPCGSGKKFKKCCVNKPVEELLDRLAEH